jgi:hypothetical protein
MALDKVSASGGISTIVQSLFRGAVLLADDVGESRAVRRRGVTRLGTQGSALAGAIARIPTHPIDTLKARLQTQRAAIDGAKLPTARELFVRIAQTEGLRGMYRGLGITLTAGPVATVLYFTTYEVRWARGGVRSVTHPLPYPSQMARDSVGRILPGTLSHLSAGMIAEAVSCLLFVPIDVIKERMQVQGGVPPPTTAGRQGSVYYRNTVHAARTIFRGEGLRGVYKGYWATVGSFGPFSALYFALYEQFKARALAMRGSSELHVSDSLVCAASAGGIASALTNPLDIVKLRMQVQRAGNLDFGYRGFSHGLKTMLREEGVRALFRGAGTRVLFHAPTTALTMTLFESCKSFAQRLLQD